MNKGLFLILVLSLVAVLFMSSSSFTQGTGQSESITLTTYYPSPYGVYKTLRLFPQAVSPGNNCTNAGEMAYDSGSNKPVYCDGSTTPSKWVAIGGGGVSYTVYCYTDLVFGAPVCPGSPSIGTQGPCDTGFKVQKVLSVYGCNVLANFTTGYFLTPVAGHCGPNCGNSSYYYYTSCGPVCCPGGSSIIARAVVCTQSQ